MILITRAVWLCSTDIATPTVSDTATAVETPAVKDKELCCVEAPAIGTAPTTAAPVAVIDA